MLDFWEARNLFLMQMGEPKSFLKGRSQRSLEADREKTHY